MTELVHLDVANRIATITLDSEHNRNALSRQLVTELVGHLTTAEADPDVLAIVIRSAHRVFCSGADLSEAADGAMTQGTQALIALQRQILAAAKPVVVVLGGPVRAGGLGIVGAAELARAPADGYTLLFALASNAGLPHLSKASPYKSLTEFSPIAAIGGNTQCLVVPASVPADNRPCGLKPPGAQPCCRPVRPSAGRCRPASAGCRYPLS